MCLTVVGAAGPQPTRSRQGLACAKVNPNEMVPAGYMAKRVVARPDWLPAERVSSIYSVSGCVSDNFAEYITFWRHNGYWLFDSPAVITDVAPRGCAERDGRRMPLVGPNESWRLGRRCPDTKRRPCLTESLTAAPT